MKNLNKQIQSFTFPLITSNLLQVIISQVSLIIISRKSIDSFAIVATIGTFLYAFGGILGATSLAFNIYGAKALGEKDTHKLNAYISSIICLSIFIGMIFIFIELFFGRQIIQGIYGFNGDILNTATIYTFIMSPYILFTLLIFVFTNLLKIEKKTNQIFLISVCCALLQAFLSYILITGKLGIPPLGVLGSGAASMISSLVMILIYAFILKDTLLNSIKYRPSKIKFLFIKSIPMMLQECLEGLLFIIVFEGIVARLGVSILATYSIIGQGLMIAKLPTFMYGNAVTVFASQANGENNYGKIYNIAKITFLSSLLAYLIFTFSIWYFKYPFFHLFTSDPLVFKLIPTMLPIMFLVMIVSPLYEISKYLLQSLEMSSKVFILTAIANIIITTLMIIIWYLKKLSFMILYSFYGLNFLSLGLVFTYLFIKHIKQAQMSSDNVSIY